MASEAATTGATRTLRIAVVGCAHGELDKIYATIRHLDESENVKIDLLLCCGDFQAVRNESDLNALACPPKYRSMNSFWKYYSGQEVAPCTTVFVGGNHEASNYMWELFYGGWVAPSIYYLGAAGVIQFGGIRIAGLSGIYKPHDYHLGHFERPPYSESEKRSIYHVREYDVHKLMQIVEPIDIFISHDWPRGIAHCGDTQRLLRHKPFLKQEIATNVLGSEPGSKLLKKLRPSYWFSAHLHAKFAAVVHHPTGEKVTKFLALDKCLPGRAFLQVIEIPAADDDSLEITYNKEWLAVTRAYNPFLPLQRNANLRICSDLQVHQQWVESLTAKRGVLAPPPFRQTTPAYDPSTRQQNVFAACHVRNPQTEAFLELLELPYLLDRIPNPQPAQQAKDVEDEIPDDIDELDDTVATHMDDPNEIPLDSDEEEDDKDDSERKVPLQVSDPNEIPLDSDEDQDDKDDADGKVPLEVSDPNVIPLADDE